MKKPLLERFQKLAGIKPLHQIKELDLTTPRGGSMSNEHIGALDDIIDANDLGKILNVIAVLVDQKGKMEDAQVVADAVSKLSGGEDQEDEGEFDFDDASQETSKFTSPLGEDEEELDEQNITGTGASVETGDGYSYSTPKWFKKKEPMNEQDEKAVLINAIKKLNKPQ